MPQSQQQNPAGAQAQSQAQARQVEVRLRRLVGDGLPGTAGMSTVLLQVPPHLLLVQLQPPAQLCLERKLN